MVCGTGHLETPQTRSITQIATPRSCTTPTPNSSITYQTHLPEVAKLLRVGVIPHKMMVLEAVVTLQRTEGRRSRRGGDTL